MSKTSGKTTACPRVIRPLLALLAGLLATLALATPAPASAAGYELVRSFEVDSPSAIAVDGDNVYVTTSSAFGDFVTRFTTAGARVTSWTGEVDGPRAVAVDSQENVIVADSFSRILVFDPNGNPLPGGGPIVGPSGTEIADAIDIDGKGELYVTYRNLDTSGVLRLSAAGQLIASWGSEGGGDGQFSGVLGVASDGRGNVYVSDPGNNRIQKFTDAGTYVGQSGQLGSDPGQFLNPTAVAVDDRGDVYVTDDVLGRVQKFDPSGRLLDIIDLRPLAAVSSTPIDVEVDARGNVYVLDNGNPDSVYVFAPDATAPKTKITKAPKKKLTTTKATKKVKVSFKSEAGASFECRLDKAKFKPCKSQYSVKAKSKPGKGKKHKVEVRASDAAGNVGKPAKAKFRLIRKG